ncbi:galactonate operon transcriptional repressor [Asticcacaulis biprosthecium C19]|uniref:Galactonate operon transcriptional repressor n=1 Tax=Asticcacaulis biprosthecium C19 TaxID=715226 RepID=F4QI23_9CAUL|nr:galactonate operon transcriptional repressor [Asticcacaulis biprosthecium C19]
MNAYDKRGRGDATETPLRHHMGQGRLHGALAHRLGVDILRGVYRQGQTLPNEMDSSSTLEISRSAYREAIRILAAKGMVESRPKTGTRVTARTRWNILDPEVLGWMFETEPSEKFILDLFELRLITEPTAAAFAAQRRQPEHIEAMDHALIVMAQQTLATEAGRQADLDFHDALMQASGNEALASLSSSIGAAVAWSTRYKQRMAALDRDPVPDHRAVFEAIARGDEGDARWTMESLVRLALRDTQRSMQKLG